MNGWLPRPGLTHISRTKSTSGRIASRAASGVAGLRTTPALRPARRMAEMSRWRWGVASDVNRNPVGAGFDEHGNHFGRVVDHEMDVEGEGGDFFQGGDQGRAEGQRRDEMAVHDVDVDQVGPGLFDGPDGVGDAAEIGGKQRGGDLDHVSGSLRNGFDCA